MFQMRYVGQIHFPSVLLYHELGIIRICGEWQIVNHWSLVIYPWRQGQFPSWGGLVKVREIGNREKWELSRELALWSSLFPKAFCIPALHLLSKCYLTVFVGLALSWALAVSMRNTGKPPVFKSLEWFQIPTNCPCATSRGSSEEVMCWPLFLQSTFLIWRPSVFHVTLLFLMEAIHDMYKSTFNSDVIYKPFYLSNFIH